MKNKFLAVYATLDNITQTKLSNFQQLLAENNLFGMQTSDIPYHITLGSFPIHMKSELENLIKKESTLLSSFDINLVKINHFKNKVIFIEPQINDQLLNLQKIFNGNYADNYDWTPHITLFCDKWLKCKKVKKLIENNFFPFTATITSIQLAEFFPTKIILNQPLPPTI